MEASRLGDCGSLVVILDTSILMDIVSGIIPLTSINHTVDKAYKLIVPSSVVNELRRIAEGRNQKSKRAKRALELLSTMNITIYEDNLEKADEAIVSTALSLKGTCEVIVATNDRGLRRRLRSLGIPTMYYRRARGGLEVEWYMP